MAKRRAKPKRYSAAKKVAAVAAYWAMESFESIERRLRVPKNRVIQWALENGAAPRSSKSKGFVTAATATQTPAPVTRSSNPRKFCKPGAIAAQ